MPTKVELVGLALAFTALGCQGGDGGMACGAGSVLEGGACVAAPAVTGCGPGTTLEGLVCVPTSVDASSAEDVSGHDDTGDATDDTGSADDALPPSDSLESDGSPTLTCSPACAPNEVCLGGLCEALPPPTGWQCAASAFADGATCHCDCGAVDPDCASGALPVDGCVSGACKADGSCAPCVPKCDGKECGDDGCGGECGACLVPGQTSCIEGSCGACVPACGGKQCGDDGCGGQCGQCGLGLECSFGACAVPAIEASCALHCGSVAPSGCSCTAFCADEGDCCADVVFCGCLPKCAGLLCGDDGCGGTCGSCADGEGCQEGQCVVTDCTPQTCHGHGVCEDATATCACAPGFSGPFCDRCAEGRVGYPQCVPSCASHAACDDGDVCTHDACSAEVGCQHEPSSSPCDDHDACTSGDGCKDGECAPGGPATCDDGNACTQDSCDSGLGCAHIASGAVQCEDGDACTTGDLCSGATCVGGQAPSCDDANPCTDDACASKAGCTHVPNDAPCTLSDACSFGAICDGGACTSTATKDCDDGNPCTNDQCNASTGECAHSAAVAGSSCDDDDLCTTGEVCGANGVCASGAKRCALTVTTGLVAHFSAGVLVSMTRNSDDSVLTWHDLTGLLHDLVLIDPTAPPVLDAGAVNGRPGVRFLGSAGLSSDVLSLGTAATIMAVACSDGGESLGMIVSHGEWEVGESSSGALGFTAATGAASAPSSVEDGHCFVVIVRTSPSGSELNYIETSTTSTGNSTVVVAAANGPLTVGGPNSGVTLGEFLIYDRALTDSERDNVATYLRTAWGFAPPTPDVAWFDAADTATLVFDGAGDLAQWNDKSGLGRHAKVGADVAPAWYGNGTSNGMPAVRFDGPGVRLRTDVFDTAPNVMVFAVFELDNAQPSASVVAQGAAFGLNTAPCSGCPTELVWTVAGGDASPAQPVGAGEWVMATATQDGTMSALTISNAPPQSAAHGPIPPGSAPLALGNSASGDASMGGFLAEIRAYAVALSSTDSAFVEALLRVKYGL